MNPNVVLSVERPGKDNAEVHIVVVVVVAGVAEALEGSGKCFRRPAPLAARIPRCLSNLEMEDQCTAVTATQLDAEPASRKANTKGRGWQRKHHTLPFSRSRLAPTKLTVAVQYSIFHCAKPALQFRNLFYVLPWYRKEVLFERPFLGHNSISASPSPFWSSSFRWPFRRAAKKKNRQTSPTTAMCSRPASPRLL